MTVLWEVVQNPPSWDQHGDSKHRHDEEALPRSNLVLGWFAVDVGPHLLQHHLSPEQDCGWRVAPQSYQHPEVGVRPVR